MGTDIHLFVEKRSGKRGNWRRATPAEWTCPWCRGTGTHHDNSKCWRCEGEGKTAKEYHERNYNLFGMLADVRNGTGFAGVVTGEGFEPLAEPRGLPEDLSLELVQNDHERDADIEGYPWLGDHSFSWCTLAEALEYDYSRRTKRQGVVTAAEYLRWKRDGRPSSWSGEVSGGGVKMVSHEEMEHALGSNAEERAASAVAIALGATPLEHYYTTVEWTTTYRESAGEAWFDFLEACRHLAADPNDVRFVFGFDS